MRASRGASAISFDPAEVEKEKGVILEEKRLRLGPDAEARVHSPRAAANTANSRGCKTLTLIDFGPVVAIIPKV